MYITVSNSSDQFSHHSSSIVKTNFNSSYSSPLLNYNDKDFNFRYTEFENLVFSPTTFDSNLVSVWPLQL
jgi:hypothetical protein